MSDKAYGFDAYQRSCQRTMPNLTSLGSCAPLAMACMGLTGEAGEVCDYVKKHLFHGHELDPVKVSRELGDVLWYVSAVAELCGLSLSDIAQANVEKLKARYPVGFREADSINRDKE